MYSLRGTQSHTSLFLCVYYLYTHLMDKEHTVNCLAIHTANSNS